MKADQENYVYKLEDKGSSLVRIDKEDYENNVTHNLKVQTSMKN